MKHYYLHPGTGLIVAFEDVEDGWVVPDVPALPGCIALGESRDEVVALIREAIALHIENLRDNGEPVPPASSEVELVETDAA